MQRNHGLQRFRSGCKFRAPAFWRLLRQRVYPCIPVDGGTLNEA